jgi:hypothetical protein
MPNSLFFGVRNLVVPFFQFTIAVPGNGCTAGFAFGGGSGANIIGGAISPANTFVISGTDADTHLDGSVHMTFSMSGTFTSSKQANGLLTVTTDADRRYNCVGSVTTTWTATKSST